MLGVLSKVLFYHQNKNYTNYLNENIGNQTDSSAPEYHVVQKCFNISENWR